MKRFIMAIVCLMTMVLSVNAQWYRAGSKAGNRMASYAHSMRRFSIIQNAKYSTYKNHGSYKEYNDSWLENFVVFGFGIGGGTINPTGNLMHTSFDLDLICMNVLMSVKLGSFEDTSHGYDISSSDATSLQFGVLFPICTYDKSEGIIGKKGKIFIAPLIGFITANETEYDGEFMHDIPYHHCSWWVSDNRETDTSCTEYGGAIMIKHGCGYLLGKVTNKSVGISVGLAI